MLSGDLAPSRPEMLGDFPPAQVDVHDISASVCGGGANGTMFTCVIVRESPPRRS